MSRDPLFQGKTRSLEDRRIKRPRVVHHDDNGRSRGHRMTCVAQHRRHVFNVVVERTPTRATGRGPDLRRATIRQPEQLVRVAMLLVIVDESWIGRGRDNASWSGWEFNGARVV